MLFPNSGKCVSPESILTQYLSHLGVSILVLTFMEEASPKLIQEHLIQCMGGILNTLRHTGAHRDSEGPQCLLGSLVSQCNPSEPAQAFFSFPSPPSGALGRIPLWEDSLICPHVDLCAEVEGCLGEL